MAAYFAALDPMTLVRALPGNVAQGIIWGIMALGVYITFRILDFADLTGRRFTCNRRCSRSYAHPRRCESCTCTCLCIS